VISLDADELEACTVRARGLDEVCILGVGTGELVAHLLRHCDARHIVAWDRDPWLLRSSLTRYDWSQAISSHRLELALGCDLARLRDRANARAAIWHPKLLHLYRMEHSLLEAQSEGPKVLVGLDQLLSEEIARELVRRGFVPCPVDLRSWSIEELDHCVRRLAPALCIAINYVHGLPEFCRDRGLEFVCWEVDPTTERFPRVAGPTPNCFIFTYRSAHVSEFRAAGFEQVRHLPLAGDPSRRPHHTGTCEPAIPVSFVGSSLEPEARRARKSFSAAYAEWAKPAAVDREALELRLERAIEAELLGESAQVLEAALDEAFPEFMRASSELELRESPLQLAWQLAAAALRRRRVASLARFGMHVWGDPGWRSIEGSGIQYRGYAGHHLEVPRIYAESAINVDVGRCYQPDIVTLRVFDVLACGGFVLAEHSADLAACFDIGRELDAYGSMEELHDKVARYLRAPEARAELALRGQSAIEQRHDISQRVQYMLQVAGIEFPSTRRPRSE